MQTVGTQVPSSARRSRGRWYSFALALAVVLSIAALAISVFVALKPINVNVTYPAGGTSVEVHSTQPVAEPTGSSTPTPVVSSTAPQDPGTAPSATRTLDPQEELTPLRQDVSILLNAPEQCDSRYLDLDSVQFVQQGGAADLDYSICSDVELTFYSAQLAEVSSPQASSEDCLTAITTAQGNQTVLPSRGLNICVITNSVGAAGEPQRGKLALVSFLDVSENYDVNLSISTWELPY